MEKREILKSFKEATKVSIKFGKGSRIGGGLVAPKPPRHWNPRRDWVYIKPTRYAPDGARIWEFGGAFTNPLIRR